MTSESNYMIRDGMWHPRTLAAKSRAQGPARPPGTWHSAGQPQVVEKTVELHFKQVNLESEVIVYRKDEALHSMLPRRIDNVIKLLDRIIKHKMRLFDMLCEAEIDSEAFTQSEMIAAVRTRRFKELLFVDESAQMISRKHQ